MSISKKRKGIILAGGNGSRLYPITRGTSKQLIPVYDKPMIFYPLSTLMLSGIKEYLIITTDKDINSFENLLGDGEKFGINIKYATQKSPDGIAQAFLIGESFIDKSPVALILGDNLFNGSNLEKKLISYNLNYLQNTIFAFPVKDPERYGVVEFDSNYKVINITEKPINPKSSYAITGIYFYDNTVVEKVKKLKPSARGELEITSLNQIYLEEGNLDVEIFGRGMAWLDTGTFESLHEASTYIRILEKRQGLKIGCPYEIAWRKKWINDSQLEYIANDLKSSSYGFYLLNLLDEKKYNKK